MTTTSATRGPLPTVWFDAIVARGDLDAVVRRVREHHDAGADHVCVQVLRRDGQLPIAEWRELASALL